MNFGMNNSVIYSPEFKKNLKPLAKKYITLKDSVKSLEMALVKNPHLGEAYGDKIYKVRWGNESKGKGKSGGFGVVYYLLKESGDPRDNAIAERVNGILKMELLEPVFQDLEAAREAVKKAVNTYNFLRPHSSISMLIPVLVHSRVLKLKRYWKNYYKTRTGKEVMTE